MRDRLPVYLMPVYLIPVYQSRSILEEGDREDVDGVNDRRAESLGHPNLARRDRRNGNFNRTASSSENSIAMDH